MGVCTNSRGNRSNMNLGGPGWFNDVFDVKVFFNTDKRSVPASGEEDDSVELFLATEVLSGKVRVTPPPNRSVWQSGITVRLESVITTFETLKSRQLVDSELRVHEAGYLTGTVDVPFEFDLSQFDIYDSYEGENFAVRHGVLVTILRPWYTFDVVTFAPVVIQNLTSDEELYEFFNNDGEVVDPDAIVSSGKAPGSPPRVGRTGKGQRTPLGTGSEAVSDGEHDNSDSDGGGVNEGKTVDVAPGKDYDKDGLTEEDLEHMVVIKDCGGLCLFDFGQAAYSVDGVLQGDIRFYNLTKPIVRVELAIIKVETSESGVNESVPFHEVLMDSRNGGDENAPFTDEGSLNVQLALGPMNLAPTFVYENEVPAEVVEPPADGSTPPLETSVRYFFRPIVYTDHEKEDEKYWNSGEVILFRARPNAIARMPGTPSRIADTTAAHSNKANTPSSKHSPRDAMRSGNTPSNFETNSASAQQTPHPTPPGTPKLPPRVPIVNAVVGTPLSTPRVPPSPIVTSSGFGTPKTPKTMFSNPAPSGTDSPV